MSIQDVEDVEAGQGGDAGGSSPQEKTVPLSALQAERTNRQRLETQLAELKGTVDTLKENQQKPKEHTEADLQAAVDAGRISQVDADRLLREQNNRKLKAEIKQEFVQENQTTERARRIETEIARYKEWKPEIMAEDSRERAAVAEAYAYHVNDLGKPENIQTELDALITAFGPASKLQKPKTPDPETHQEVGAGSGETAKTTGKPPAKLDADARKYYGDRIERGIYKDWDEVNKELSMTSPGSRRRLGIG